MSFLYVGAGGAVGAMSRYAIGLIPYKGVFPILTLMINFLGAVLIGFVVGASAKLGWSSNWTLFWKTGVCGGFTTFSTFSLETYTLVQNGHSQLAVLYALTSVVLCVVGIVIGMMLAK